MFTCTKETPWEAVEVSGVKSETTKDICRRCGLWRRADGNCWRRMEDCPMVESSKPISQADELYKKEF